MHNAISVPSSRIRSIGGDGLCWIKGLTSTQLHIYTNVIVSDNEAVNVKFFGGVKKHDSSLQKIDFQVVWRKW